MSQTIVLTRELKLETLAKLPAPPKKKKKTELLTPDPKDKKRLSRDSIGESDYETHTEEETTEVEEKELEKTEWLTHIMKKHPGVLELREKLTPVTKKPSFGTLLRKSQTESRDSFSKEILIQLMMQHLELMGYNETLNSLEDESKLNFEQGPTHEESNLMSLLYVGIKDVDKVWDLQLSYEGSRSMELIEDPEVELVDNDLAGYFDDEDLDEDESQIDVDIWDESVSSNKNIIFDEEGSRKTVSAGTLNKLIEYLSHETISDPLYAKTFLQTYQSFTTPGKLLFKLLRRYQVPKKNMNEREYNDKKKKIQYRVCAVLKKWIEDHFSDFTERLLLEISDFIDNRLIKDDRGNLAKQLRFIINQQTSGKQNSKDKKSYESAPMPITPKNIFSPKLELEHVDEEEIARQITLIDFKLFSQINSCEFLKLAWRNEKYKHRAPNLIALNKRFNDLTEWVVTTILQCDKLRKRTKVLIRFIKIAFNLRKLNNFQSFYSVLKGIEHSSIKRLRFTFEDLPRRFSDMLLDLSKLMSPENEFSSYRDVLITANKPCLPFIDLILTDIEAIEQKYTDYVETLISFKKCLQISSIIEPLNEYQKKNYNFQPVIQISKFLQNFENLTSEKMNEISLKLEPENAIRSVIN
ncbi:ras guanine nucleotide exchange factor i-related [Anaeramoeba flamelloides]|uniref:Ras guanine nucleotide exchange factor i-related n=1 Tax=Anaeramoeba flamelloides TaxID=1746091 RepID=A0AAV7ZT71_9EUKA|nr:ras guanine nucleotide exchange factor i-related [Anaeramoeba flamelloides]KAJ6230717.1 ras guanine nucleotide exchange factor i-related [Anaeramoeba flamelloides]